MKQKRIISFILAMVMIFSIFTEAAIPVYAALEEDPAVITVDSSNGETVADEAEEIPVEGSCGENLTWAFDETTGALTISGSGAMYDYEIDYNTFTTTAPWIAHKDNITSLVIEDGVTHIGNYAFGLCSNISGSLVIPDSVTAIGTGVFVNCWGFDGTLTLSENLTAIPDSVFENCIKFTGALEIPEKVTSIGISAFYGNGFTSVTIPEGVTSIGDSAFFRCRNLTELTIPSTVTNIDSGAFASCSSIAEITFDGTTVPAFANMPINPFSSMTALTTVYVPAVSYDAYAEALVSLIDSTVEIVTYDEEPPVTETFNITVVQNEGGTVTVDKTAAVAGETVTIAATPDENYEIDVIFVDGNTLDSNSFTVTGDHIVSVTFKAAESAEPIPTPTPGPEVETSGTCGENLIWAFDETTGTLTIRGTGAMNDFGFGEAPWTDHASSITSVVISDSVTSIGDYAFYGCTSLADVHIPESVTLIGNAAFSTCSSLASVDIPEGVVSISMSLFSDCKSLSAVSIPESVTSIEDYAFANCSYLASIDIPETVTYIGQGAFIGTALTSVDIPEGVTSIRSNTFDGCTSLTSINIPGTVTDIGYAAFRRCTSLESVCFGGSQEQWNAVTVRSSNDLLLNAAFTFEIAGTEPTPTPEPGAEISGTCGDNLTWSFDEATGILTISGSGAMYDYAYDSTPWSGYKYTITKVVVEEGATYIGNYAFGGCEMLTEAILPDTVSQMGTGVFSWCVLLPNVILPSELQHINDEMFNACSALESIIIPDNVTYIGKNAFNTCISLKNILIPDGVKFIDYYAFAFCDLLESITLPVSIESIGLAAFKDCGTLTTIYYGGSSSQWNAVNIESDNDYILAADVVFGNYAISVETVENGTVTVDKTIAAYGETVTVTATPDENYQLDAILVDGTAIEGNSFTVTGDHIVSATFTISETPGDVPNGTCGENLTWTFDEATGTMTISGSGAMYDYAAYETPWTDYSNSITAIEIEEGVTYIGTSAFFYCTRIASAVFPSSLQRIGGSAFMGCRGLSEVVLLEGLTTLDAYAFSSCINVTTVEIPVTVSTINENVFYMCNNLTTVNYKGTQAQWSEITINENNAKLNDVTIICTDGEITNKHNVTFDVYIETFGEDGSTSLERHYYETIAVEDGSAITVPEIEIPEGYSVADEWFYTADNGETGTWDFANYTVTTALSLTTNIYKDVTVTFDVQGVGEAPDPVTAKKYYYIELPQPVAEGYTFAGWFSDADCTLSVTDNAFESDTTLYAKWEEGTAESEPVESGSCGDNATYKLYDTDDDGTVDKLVISGTGAMYDYEFLYNSETSELYYNTPWWDYRSGITAIELKSGITTVGKYAFSDCINVTDVIIPYGIVSIGSGAFYNCASLAEIALPDSLTSISNLAFYDCAALLAVTIPDGVTYIGPSAFNGCSSITEMVIPDGVTSIGAYTFNNCTSLGKIILPDSITSIGEDAFCQCESLAEITLPAGITSIGYGAFTNCYALTDIIIPDGVESVGMTTFRSCYSLKTVYIPVSVTSIGLQAFYVNTSLETVYYGGTAEQWTAITIEEGNTEFTDADVVYGMYAVAVQKPENGTATVDKTVVSAGETVTVTATADEYYELDKILVNGEEIEGTSFEVEGTSTVLAVFKVAGMDKPVNGLTAEKVFSKTVVLTWEPHECPLVEGYEIIRDGEVIATTTECTFTERDLTADTRYSYAVLAYIGEDRTPLSCISVATVTPEIKEIYVDNEWDKLNDAHNRIYIKVSDNKNLGGLGEEKTSAELYLVEDTERVLLSELEINEELSSALTAVYTFDWDISTVEDGEYNLVFVLTDIDGTAAEKEKAFEIDRSQPEKIASFIATGTVKDIVLSWTIASEIDTEVYRIYRRAGEEDEFTLLKEIKGRDVLAYNDTDVVKDVIYEYYIVGVNIFDQEGEATYLISASLEADVTGPVVTKLTPANLTFISGIKEFTIKAEDNLAVTGAELYYSVDEKATWTLLAEFDETFRAPVDTTLMPEGVVYIKGVAYDAAGNESNGLTYKYTVDNTGPQQVQGLAYESTSVTVTLKWEDVADEDLDFFRVEKKNDDGTYTKISDVYTTLGHNIYGLAPDTQYVYRVTAYDKCGNEGVPSEDIVVNTLNDTTAPVITDMRPEPGSYSDNIELSVTAKDESDIAEITVQVATNAIDWTDLYTETYTEGSKLQTLKYTLPLDSYDEGIINVRGIAKDFAGNKSNDGIDAPCVQYKVDRTAPAAPSEVSAEGNCGYIEISWVQEESDVKGYSVYRAETEDGEYQLLQSDVQALNYFDREVEGETTYFYKITVKDTAGNISDYSEVVSATAIVDTEAPEIYGIAPKTESKLGTGYRKVGARILDNASLSNVSVGYSKDGENYVVLFEKTDIDSYTAIAEADVPAEEFADGNTVYVKFTAVDTSGNTTDVIVEYAIDAIAPAVSDAMIEFRENEVIVSWAGGTEDDLAGYRIYRKTADEEYSLVGQCVSGETAEYSWADTDLSEDEITYFYKIAAVDKVGNITEVETEAITLPERGVPVPVISCDNAMEVGVEYVIDGSQSSDNSSIVSYLFDFGDGTTSTKEKPVHKYEEVGKYVITLTVTDDNGHEATTTKTITVTERKLIGTVKVFVFDETGVAVPGASVYFDLSEDSQIKKYTNSSGYVTFTAEAGKHKIGAVIPDNEWLPASEEIIIRAGEEVSLSMTMVHHRLIEGEFTVNRMTLDEIEAAGIDPTLPENQHMFKLNISFLYDDVPITIPTIYNSKTKEFKGGGGNGGVPGLGLLNIAVIDIDKESEAPTKIALFQTPAEGSFLKEFFDVRLHIINNSSPEYKMTDNVISLNVPEGLTIIDTDATEGSDIVKIDEIAGGTTETIAWLFRGDTEGEYDLTADYSGTLSEFNEQIHTQFITAEPIKVYGMSAVKLIAEVNNTIYYGALYFNLSIENTSSIDIYLPKLDIVENTISEYFLNLSDDSTGIEHTEPELKQLNTYLYNSAGLATPIGRGNDVTRLAPGEKLTRKYVVYNVVDRDNVLYLKNAVMKAADDCGILCEVRKVDMDLYNLDNVEEKFKAFDYNHGIHEYRPSLSMFEYISDSENFLYPYEALYRINDDEEQRLFDSYMVYQAVRKFNIFYKSDRIRDATRALIIKLLTEETFTRGVEERLMEKYTNVVIPLLNMVSAAFVDGSIESKVSSEGLKYIEELSGDSAKVQKLIGALREDGEEGFTEELTTILTSYGIGIVFNKASLMNWIKDQDYKKNLTDQFKGMGKVVKQLDAGFSAWYKANDIVEDLMYISATREEADFLLEKLVEWTSSEWHNVAEDSVENTIHRELKRVQSEISGGYERVMTHFADELAKEEIKLLGKLGIEKVITKLFGAEGLAIYAIVMAAFDIVDKLTGWGDHVDATLKLEVNYAISLAIESGLEVRYRGTQGPVTEDRPEKIMEFMKILKYMIKMRMIGEQDFDNLAVDQTIKDTNKVLDIFNDAFNAAIYMNSDISRDQKAEVGVWFPIVLDWIAEKLGEAEFEYLARIYDMKMLRYIQQRADTIYTEDDLRQVVVDYTYESRLIKVNGLFGVEYKNVDEYLDATISRLVEYRDSIFSVYYEDLVVPDAPPIELDYLNYCTVHSYSTNYEYSFNGSTWYKCTDSQIEFEPSNVMKWLWVRRGGTETEPAGNIAKIAIPAMTKLTGDFKMVYDGGNYKVSGLPEGTYQYVFTNDRSILAFTDSFTVAESETVELTESAGWTYLAVQAIATETSFASQICYLTKYNAWVVDEEDRQITNLMESTTKEDLLTYYRNMGQYIAFETAMDTIGDLIATGDVIQIGISMFKAVVLGDVDGDAYTTMDDLGKMIRHANAEELLEAEYLDAGCITQQEDIDLFDIFAIISYIETGSFAG